MSVMDNIRIVLVSPLYGGNVGSVCRAMANTGISDLAVVAARNLNMQEAEMMACHAGHILEARTVFDSLEAAVADCREVVGTTARGGLYRQHAATPREQAGRILDVAQSGRVALVFGREDNGLDNAELALCTQIIQIPTTDAYSSLNLSQAVMICCHELFVASGTYEPPAEKSEDATSDLRERMFALWRQALLDIGFMEPAKADHMMLGLRRILGRGRLTVDDVHILMGMARQSSWASRGRVKEDA
jgi:tRNA/rRNA methyltransferase